MTFSKHHPLSTARRRAAALGVLFAASLALAACGSGSGEAETLDNGDEKKITIGIVDGWAEGVAVTNLWEEVLKQEGYDVEVQTLDVSVLYTSLAKGDIDVYMDTPLPVTHKDYVDKYGDDIMDLSAWYDKQQNTITVNDDSPAKSIGDLKKLGKEYGNKLVGIEPGAGLTKAAKKAVKDYQLDNLDFTTSSTQAMIAELQGKLKAKKNVAVTLWHPHWAYTTYPLRDLEDPKGSMGEPDHNHMYGHKDFADKFPNLTEHFEDFELNDDQISELLEEMYVGKDADEKEGVKTWMKKNPDFVEKLKG